LDLSFFVFVIILHKSKRFEKGGILMKRVRLIASIVMLCLGIFLISTTSATAGMSKDLGKMAGKAASVAQQLLDINSATLEQLQQLPGIGEKIAQRIVKYREDHGPFAKVEDLLNVEGIGEKKLEKIKPLIQIKEPEKK
jgi:competence protein ComEA